MPHQLNKYYKLGYVSRTHGIKGHITVKLDVDDASRYGSLKEVFLGEEQIPYKLKEAVIRQDTASLLFEKFSTLEQVQQFVGQKVYLPLSSLPKLDDRSLYLHEAIGMQVIDKTLGELGEISNVYDAPIQPVAAVMISGKEVLFPLLRSFIIQVDRSSNQLHVDLPDGLIDVYTDPKG